MANTWSTQIIAATDPHAIEQACRLLKADQLVALPTETVYGLAGNAASDVAVSQIFSTKNRPSFDPLIVHVAARLSNLDALAAAGVIAAEPLSTSARSQLAALMRDFWPGALTLILPKGPRISELACNGLPTVAVRCPSHPTFQEVLQASGLFLAAPSANQFGHVSPSRSEHVLADLEGRIPLILDAGPCDIGIESTILAWSSEAKRMVALRHGAIELDRLGQTLGYVPTYLQPLAGNPDAPGMLERHYAPRLPLFLLDQNGALMEPERVRSWMNRNLSGLQRGHCSFGLIATRLSYDQAALTKVLRGFGIQDPSVPWVFVLSPGEADSSADTEAASRLFLGLRLGEVQPVSALFAALPPKSGGLWPAIQDRLWKARFQDQSSP